MTLAGEKPVTRNGAEAEGHVSSTTAPSSTERLAALLRTRGARSDGELAGALRVLFKLEQTPGERLARLMRQAKPLTAADAAGEVREHPQRLVPFRGRVPEQRRAFELTKRIESGEATREEARELADLIDKNARERTFGYELVSMLSDQPAFWLEYAAGGAVLRGAKAARAAAKAASAARGAQGLVARELQGAILEGASRSARRSLLARIGDVAAGGAGRAGVMEAAPRLLGEPGRISGSAYQRALPDMGLSEDEAADLAIVFAGSTEDFLSALPRAAVDILIETVSEGAGALLPATGALQSTVMRWALGTKRAASVSEFTDRVARPLGWHSLVPEVLEERLGDALRATGGGVGLEEGKDPLGTLFPGWRDLAVELTGLALTGSAFAAAGAAIGMQPGRREDQQGRGVTGGERSLEGAQASLTTSRAPTESSAAAEQAETVEPVPAGEQVALEGAPEPEADTGASAAPVEEPGVLRRVEFQGETFDVLEERDDGSGLLRDAEGGLFEVRGMTLKRLAEAPPEAGESAPVAPPVRSMPARRPAAQRARAAAPSERIVDVQPGEVEVAPGVRGAAEPAVGAPGRTVSRDAVVRALAGILRATGSKAPIRAGRVPEGREGAYEPHVDVIRVGDPGNLSAVAHEVGQAISRSALGDEAPPEAAIQELKELAYEFHGPDAVPENLLTEGFGELLFHYAVTGKAEQEAPHATAWLDEWLSTRPKVEKAVRKAQTAATDYRAQGSVARVEAQLSDPMSPGRRLKRLAKGVRRAVSWEGIFERLLPLQAVEEAAEQIEGRKLRPSESPYQIAKAYRGVHAATARSFFERGVTDITGSVRRSRGIREAFKLIGYGRKNRRTFAVYLYARRAVAMHEDPQGRRNPGISYEDARNTVAALETPALKKAGDIVHEFREALLDYLAEASPTYDATVAMIRRRDPGSYVPLLRDLEGLDRRARQLTERGVDAGSSITDELVGGEGRVIDPLQTLLSETERLVRLAHERVVLESILRLSELPGMGYLVEEVPVQEGESPGLGGRDGIYRVIREDGEHWYILNEDLHGVLSGMDIAYLPAWVDMTAGALKRTFSLGTTGLDVGFSFVTNTLRDLGTYWVHSQNGAWTPTILQEWAARQAQGAVHHITGQEYTDPWLKLYMQLGGERAGPLGWDKPIGRSLLRRISSGPVMRVVDPRNLFDTLRDALQSPEAAPRVAEIKLMAEGWGWHGQRPLTMDESIQLRLALREVTTDFGAGGRWAGAWGRVVPYLTASLQGPRASWRALRHHPERFALRLSYMTALTLWAWWRLKDEEWYQELEIWERSLYWHIPVGPDEVVRIPRPFELGQLGAAMPEALAQAWYEDDPEAVKAWGAHAFRNTWPDVLPQVAVVPAEQLANENFFFDRPIVTDPDAPVEEQFNDYTSRAAVVVGDVFGISPQRVDHAIEGVFGRASMAALKAFQLGRPPKEGERELADLPVVGRLFLPGGTSPRRSKSASEVLDLFDEYKRRSKSKRDPETPEARQMRLQLGDARRAIFALWALRSQTDEEAERRQFSREAAAIARDALEAEGAGKVERERFQELRRDLEKQRKALEAALGKGSKDG